MAAGLFATSVQLTVYGGCLLLQRDAEVCVDEADRAGRRAVGRPPPVLDEDDAD
jgi:hypothetical protein